MSSNLLAHHLRVLESAGLVRRSPSESDGRRSYVRLVQRAFTELGHVPGQPLPGDRVVFVCSGNSARSQLAAALWAQNTGRRAASAGTRPARRIHPGARRVARQHALPLLADIPRSADDVLADDDMVVTVCDAADRELSRPHLHWSIPDPVPVGTPDAFEDALRQITGRIDGWVGNRTESHA